MNFRPEPNSPESPVAIYRFSMKHGSRAKGSSSGAHARYILRQERYEYAADQLTHFESGNMPKWAQTHTDFWDAADRYESANARLYTEFEIALPRELTFDPQRTLVRNFVETHIGDRHPYTIAFHEVEAMDGNKTPHVHVMFTTRTLDSIERGKEQFFKRANPKAPEQGGAPKERSWIAKDKLIELRQSWEQHANLALKRAGQDATIDCRTLEAQGIDRKPEPKLSPYEAMLWKQGVKSERVEAVLVLRELAAQQHQQAANANTITTLREIAILKKSEAKITQTLAEQRKSLESALRERKGLDAAIELDDAKLKCAPGSREDASELARDRLYGSVLGDCIDSMKHWKAERNRIAEQMEAQLKQGFGVIKEIPKLFQETKQLFEVQQQLNAAQDAYQDYLEEINSPTAKARCEEFGKQLYASKVEIETERNQRLEEALLVRADITLYQKLISDTEQMLADVHRELKTEYQKLSEPIRATFLAPDEETITIGQNASLCEFESLQETQQQELSLGLKLSLQHSLDSDPL
ncbi:MAG: MobA/MobL family protein [Cyanothece sp. SIO1E1]|nr:MobA/MobL family protein [Cyanothece sp. SIO1E1]